MPKFETDANGNITTPGRFQGRHVDEVMDYLEGLEATIAAPAGDPPPAERTPPREDPTAPARRLAAQASNRIDPLQLHMFARLEADDEEAFAKTVTDYAKYKDRINELKNGNQAKGIQPMHPAARANKGLHRTLYINVKAEDPKIFSRLEKPLEDEPPPSGEEPVEEPVPSPAEVPPAAPRAAAPRRPAPAPPMAAATPAARPPAGGKAREPKLVADYKIKEFCRKMGLNEKEYLLRLEDGGTTQADLDRAGQPGQRTAPRSVYDRKLAARR